MSSSHFSDHADALEAHLDLERSPSERHQVEIDRRESEVSIREQALVRSADLAESMLAAAVERNATSDALDAFAEERERAEDLDRMLSPPIESSYGTDWPARRHAVLQRNRAKADRAAAHADLSTLVSDFRNGQGGGLVAG